MSRWRDVAPLVLVVVIAGCGATPATVSPPAATGTAASSADGPWIMAQIDQPPAIVEGPSLPPAFQCHPCHFLAANQLFAVAPTPNGLVAVGVQQPPAA
ncbi:MAG TPA: hypothetical protein VMH24_06275, partial [Candidatus Sulfotelmatobacter sp.]|nr:hypothetical protein [Candidatus Sulfotelmatobacter sp.]